MGGGCARPLLGCAVVVLGLMVVASLIPLLIGLAIAAVALLSVVLLPVLLVGVWRAPWTLQTKRAITGTVLYPAGAYFLVRHTRLNSQVKAGAVLTAAAATLLIVAAHHLAPVLLLVLGVAFLALFLGSGSTAGGTIIPAAPPRGTEHIPAADLRGLLEIEQAQSGSERRLLLAREFSRVAELALAGSPRSLETWPDARRVATLRAEARFLLASATDVTAVRLPESPLDDALSASELTAHIRGLDGFLRRLEAVPRSEASLEALRILTRDRGQVQASYDRVVQAITAPTTSSTGAPAGLPAPSAPLVNPLPNPSRAKP